VKHIAAWTVLILTCVAGQAWANDADAHSQLRVLTFNVWHGLRSGESNTRFPGEDRERKQRRFEYQIQELKRLAPDLLLFQEVNPNQRQARRYAEALGYDEIHKVCSCGIHLGFKIPANVNEGLAILARPELRLRRVGKKRLSGNAKCAAAVGIQTNESRYALFGEISIGKSKLLVVTTHLSAPPHVPPGCEDEVEQLVSDGLLEPAQRDEILEILERKRERNLDETRILLAEIDKRRGQQSTSGVVVPVLLGGDFNTEPVTPSIDAIQDADFEILAVGQGFLTWDPSTNHVNYGIGSKRAQPLPTFDVARIEELLDTRRTIARQIDHLFAAGDLRLISSEMVLNRDLDGMFPSDHFGILAVLDVGTLSNAEAE
jgi:endonuclease/exonuclease/phosphatase family metal-dependent hydrolase